MPTYVYKCKYCSHTFDKFEPMSAQPTKFCPKCEKETVERQISGGAGILFIGSGFYCNDYKKKKETTA